MKNVDIENLSQVHGTSTRNRCFGCTTAILHDRGLKTQGSVMLLKIQVSSLSLPVADRHSSFVVQTQSTTSIQRKMRDTIAF